MSLEELLRNRTIMQMKPNHNLALNSIKRARRDIDTAQTLITNQKFDWALAVAYNAMLTAGRAIMINKGYRPSSTEGHVAVMKFLQTTLKTETSQRMTTLMNGMRKKRHRIIYEDMDIVSKNEAQQAIKWAEEFVNTIEKMIRPETP